MTEALIAWAALALILFLLAQYHWKDPDYIPEVITIEYLLEPYCGSWADAREWVGDPFCSIFDEEGGSQPRQCSKCWKPRWRSARIHRSQVHFDFVPVNDYGDYAPKYGIPCSPWPYPATGLRVLVTQRDGREQETKIIDLRPQGYPSVREEMGLPPVDQCLCIPGVRPTVQRDLCSPQGDCYG